MKAVCICCSEHSVSAESSLCQREKNPLRGKMTKIMLRNETYSQNETKAICDGTHDDNSGA